MKRSWCGYLAAASLWTCAFGCGPVKRVDATSAVDEGRAGKGILSLRWRFEMADTAEDSKPQEFASPAISEATEARRDRLYVGSQNGVFYCMEARTGRIVWRQQLGAISSRPTLGADRIYVGTDDGHVLALDPDDGRELWRYETRGSILEPPVVSGDLVFLSNEADQVYALDRAKGTFRWQYKGESEEEFTLRGHAGVVLDDDLLFTGFSNGTVIALRQATGSVAWLTSLKGQNDRFVDVDATPIVVGDRVFAVSSAGGVYGLDRATGLIRWRVEVSGGGGLTTDGERLYLAAAEQGIYALDLDGNILWRQGTRGGGEPAEPVVSGDYLLYSLSDAGLYIADKFSGKVLQYFDPGYGVSSTPTLTRHGLYVVSNSAVLYAMTLRR